MGFVRFLKKIFLKSKQKYPAALLTTIQTEVPSDIRFEAVAEFDWVGGDSDVEEEFVLVFEERKWQPTMKNKLINLDEPNPPATVTAVPLASILPAKNERENALLPHRQSLVAPTSIEQTESLFQRENPHSYKRVVEWLLTTESLNSQEHLEANGPFSYTSRSSGFDNSSPETLWQSGANSNTNSPNSSITEVSRPFPTDKRCLWKTIPLNILHPGHYSGPGSLVSPSAPSLLSQRNNSEIPWFGQSSIATLPKEVSLTLPKEQGGSIAVI